jgi:hypothetical protein
VGKTSLYFAGAPFGAAAVLYFNDRKVTATKHNFIRAKRTFAKP